jgi:hypothetical protein
MKQKSMSEQYRLVMLRLHDMLWERNLEIERLHARVEVLERVLRHYADDAYNGHNANGSCARAALEAKS